MVYQVPLIIFMDNVSGNISKQWNKHYVIYMSNASLPREMLDQEFNVRFVTSSLHASPMELMHAMKEFMMRAVESGVIAWDCRDEEEVLLIPNGLFHGGDNPMQAELCSHAGLNCNFFCRTCQIRGTKEYKQSNNGYPGLLQTPAETINEIKSQLSNATLPGATEKVKTSVSSTGVRDTLSSTILHTLVEMGKRLRKCGTSMHESDVKDELEKELAMLLSGHCLNDMVNPLLGMSGINIHLNTPTEILHTVLLGVVKYFWGQTIFFIEKAKLLDVFHSRLNSIEHDVLNAPSLNTNYMCSYKGSLIGKHFKSLAQVMPFVIYDLVPQNVMDGWTTMGELVILLWHTEIPDLEVYLAKLSRTIKDFLNVTAKCAPSILISKPKFHFLVHLPAYIRRFGPAIVFSTEQYESFNHHGPSQDTCQRFAWFDIIKHILTGGYWYDTALKKWVHASPFILDFLHEHPAHAKLLGVRLNDDEIKSGTGEFCHIKDSDKGSRSFASKPVKWKSTLCAKLNTLPADPHKSEYHQGRAFITKEGDKVKIDGNVILMHPPSCTGFAIGRIREILIGDPLSCAVSHVAVQLFTFAPNLHPLLHLPCVVLTDETIVVDPSVVLCGVNLQHNCIDRKCTKFMNCTIQQEWTLTQRSEHIIQHEPTPAYFLNTFSIHNYFLIQAMVPPLLQDSPPRMLLADVDKVRTLATQQIRQKKAQCQGLTDVTVDTEVTSLQEEGASNTPAFDRPVPKKNTRKRGAKNKDVPVAASSATQTSAMVGPSVQALSSNMTQTPMGPSIPVFPPPPPPTPTFCHIINSIRHIINSI
ncbi:hypothetical protein V8E55_006856 [Tylopilus felleus]